MRADRLLSLLMLLQTRGRMTAEELAEELEVSVRTIYRDMDALSASGVPIYADRGHGGGIALLDNYRTTLTGFTEDEIRTLFLMSIPAPLDDLGLSQDFRSALLKLNASVPSYYNGSAESSRQRIHIDLEPWGDRSIEPVPFLQVLLQAVREDRMINLRYKMPYGHQMEGETAPYGLVAKAGAWYVLVKWKGQIRPIRLSRILSVEVLGETFERPDDFDLQAFWKDWMRATIEASRYEYRVTARIAPSQLPNLPNYFGNEIESQAKIAVPDEDGWITISLPFEHFFAARDYFLGRGGAAEVISPEPLRLSVIDFARQVLRKYQE